jgi:hypothetical protein
VTFAAPWALPNALQESTYYCVIDNLKALHIPVATKPEGLALTGWCQAPKPIAGYFCTRSVTAAAAARKIMFADHAVSSGGMSPLYPKTSLTFMKIR